MFKIGYFECVEGYLFFLECIMVERVGVFFSFVECWLNVWYKLGICLIVVYEEIVGVVSGRWFFLLCLCYSIFYGSFGGCKFMVWGIVEVMIIVYWVELLIELLCFIFLCSLWLLVLDVFILLMVNKGFENILW